MPRCKYCEQLQKLELYFCKYWREILLYENNPDEEGGCEGFKVKEE